MSTRREFMIHAGAGIATASLGVKSFGQSRLGTAAADFAKWKGFFVGSFGPGRQGLITRTATIEDDYRAIADWGFTAVRLRIDYTQWLNYTDQTPQGTPYAKDFYNIKESFLVQIDEAINLALKHNLRVLLGLFHAPGFDGRDNATGRNDYTGPYNLWTDKVAQDAFAYYWGMFAKRYAGIRANLLAFDLLNEPTRSNGSVGQKSPNFILYPTGCTNEIYAQIMMMAIDKVRQVSPDRPLFAEGLEKLAVADEVVPELIPSRIGQSIHPYAPTALTHFDAFGANSLPVPTWPYKQPDGSMFGPEQLAELYKPFGDLTNQGIPVLCGEFGVSARTPNDVAMRYTADMLEVLNVYHIGWMYWDLRGIPGAAPYHELSAILDSTRRDVKYEFYRDKRGSEHSLNRTMLTLLQKYL